jgi:hypothetical protein
METTRPWRFGITFGGRMAPLQGEVSWEQKKVRFLRPDIPFRPDALYEAVFVDPTYKYSLIRAYLRPLRILREENGDPGIAEATAEFFHRKQKS